MSKAASGLTISERKEIRKKYNKLFIPVLGTIMIGQIFGMIDTFFISQADYMPNAVGALGLTQFFIIIGVALAYLIGSGSGYYLAKAKVNGDKKEAERIVSAFFVKILIMGIIIMLIGFFASEFLVNLAAGGNQSIWEEQLGTDGLTIPGSKPIGIMAQEYIMSMSAFAPFLMGSVAAGLLLSIDGKEKPALLIMITSAIINSILDYSFIHVIEGGMLGAGLATGTGYLITFGIFLYYFLARSNTKLRGLNFKDALVLYPKTAKAGLPNFFLPALPAIISLMFTIGLGQTAGDHGSAYASVFGSIYQWLMLVMAIPMAIATAAQPIISELTVLKKQEDIKRIRGITFTYAAIGSIIPMILFMIPQISNPLIGIFAGLNATEMAVYGGSISIVSIIFFSAFIFMSWSLITTVYMQGRGFENLAAGYTLARAGLIIAIVFAFVGFSKLDQSGGFGHGSEIWVFLAIPAFDILSFTGAIPLLIRDNKAFKNNEDLIKTENDIPIDSMILDSRLLKMVRKNNVKTPRLWYGESHCDENSKTKKK